MPKPERPGDPSVTDTTVSQTADHEPLPARNPGLARASSVSRAKAPRTDLQSIRDHLGSNQFGIVDTESGEKRIPMTWVAVILVVTALASLWITNMLAP